MRVKFNDGGTDDIGDVIDTFGTPDGYAFFVIKTDMGKFKIIDVEECEAQS